MFKVAVLLSSYNGEKYIEEQIQSILNQKNVEVELYIRDDGSTDKTIFIIKKLMKENLNIHLICEKNVGYEESFMKLIYEIVPETDYYAFSDQDDVWLEEKLFVAIKKICKQSAPAMYYSHLCEVDECLKNLKKERKKELPPSKVQALFGPFARGCTIVFNEQMMKILKKGRVKKKTSHDFWVGLVATYLGNVVYDETPYILYRKHENTVTHRTCYLKKIKGLLSGKVCNNYAIQLLQAYSDMLDDETICCLEKIANYDKSLENKLYAIRNVKKTTLKGTILLKFCFLFNRIEKINVLNND